MKSISLSNVSVRDDFWSPRQRLITDVTIPYMEKILRDEVPGAEKSHAIRNFEMAAGEAHGEFYGMVFQDSDVAKWLESAAYSLAIKPDNALHARVECVVELIGRAQQKDGYLNTYFTVKEPQNRWSNFLECHELYCAGHMMEAAAALKESLNYDKLLNIILRFADHIIERFGSGNAQAVPGHQEIEIGFLRLYHVTKQKRYLDMALRFLDLRGQDPDWFVKNTSPHPGICYGGYDIDPADTVYNQSDMPVRDQTKARGHAVRQVYMLTAMADAAASAGDKALQEACNRLFDNITERQMYITGAIGASAHHESFTTDYDLPADRCYGETCASVSMVFFAHNMLKLKPDGRYADLMERELFNAALAGMQLTGERFFYVNPLEVDLRVSGKVPGYEHVMIERPQWHTCACCPPNLARLIASLGGYVWGEDDDTVYSHLFIANRVQTKHAEIALETQYPWQGSVRYRIENRHCDSFRLAIHIPEYANDIRFAINGKSVTPIIESGYAYLTHTWQPGDTIDVSFPMMPRRVYAHPMVRDAIGKVALAYGPIIYCLESADNGFDLNCLRLPRESVISALPHDEKTLGGIIQLTAKGFRETQSPLLYPAASPEETPVTLTAIPYYAWSNRGQGEMRVWIRE